MKRACLLLFFYCCCIASMAQQHQRELWLQQYIAIDAVNAGCWLVNIYNDAVPSFLLTHRNNIVRRLSATDFILTKQTSAAQLAIPGIAALYAANNNWKLSPRLLTTNLQWLSKDSGVHVFYIHCTDTNAIRKYRMPLMRPVYKDLLQISASREFVQKNLLPDETVTFIDIVSKPAKEELSVANFDNSLNTVNILHNDYPSLNGRNTVVSIKENKPDEADIDFNGRFISTAASSNTLSTHASTMATIVAGGGNSFYTSLGVAPAAQISSSSFAVLLPDPDAFYQQYRISVQNHSYGTGIENFYGAEAASYDASTNTNPSLLHVFSAGNSGNQAPADGQYAGISGFANITGSFKMAKNLLTVGALDSFGTVATLSSRGPAFDGRIKPELVAFGEDGSSGAAALVSGTALVLQQAYKEMHGGVLPDAALVKAILLNTATSPADSNPISFSRGYGSLDVHRAVLQIKTAQIFSASVQQGQFRDFSITVPPAAKNLKILLAWADPAAAPNAFTALVNDLDLTVTHTASGRQWQPWVLNSFPHKDSLQLPATRKRDSLNTVEQVSIGNPAAGDYTITVQGSRIPAGTQSFFIVYQWDTVNTFKWTYPTKTDNLMPGKWQLARWKTNYSGTGQLEYKYAGSNSWQTISNASALINEYGKWITPDSDAVAQLRMTINGSQWISDSFTISRPLQPGVGFNCPDTALLFWNRYTGVDKFTVSRLGNQYMEPYQLVTDTAVFINKITTSSNWFSAAPLLAFNKTGIYSQAINYTTQGIQCYLSSFTADLSGNKSSLALHLGSVFRVQRVFIEKIDANGVYQPLQAFSPPLQLQYSITDNALHKGINQYRVRIALSTGQVIYSNTEQVIYLSGSDYIIYPNPVHRPQPINIVTAELGNQVLRVFNIWGQPVYSQKLTDLSMQIASGALAKGIYFYSILKDGKLAARGKLVVD